MRNKVTYMVTLLLLGAFSVLALLAPQVADRWYDGQTLGLLSYEKMEFEPCEITPYHSFPDQMNALAGQVTEGVAPYAVQLREREDALDDEEMVQIANEELEKLYQAEILPRKITIEKLAYRYFYQLYAMPVQTGDAVLQNVCYWTLIADIDGGSIALTLDSTYHKIYGFNMAVTTPLEKVTPSIEPWLEKQKKDDFCSMAQAWCRYWELADADISERYSNDNVASTDIVYGGISGEYRVVFSDGSSFSILNRLENPMMYYAKKGNWTFQTGMGTLLMVM